MQEHDGILWVDVLLISTFKRNWEVSGYDFNTSRKQSKGTPPTSFISTVQGRLRTRSLLLFFFLVLADWEGELVCVSRAFQQHRPSGTPPSLHVSTEQSAGDTNVQLNSVLGSRDTQPAGGNKTSYGQTFQVTNPQARVHHFQKPQHNSRPEKKKKKLFSSKYFQSIQYTMIRKTEKFGCRINTNHD